MQLKQTDVFRKWWSRLKDQRALALLGSRLHRLECGHFGDAAAVGNGISKLRIHYGPGYRVYFVRRSASVILLLCGGDKNSQGKDIKAATRLVETLGAQNDQDY
jgi:putative addiction module killer protein